MVFKTWLESELKRLQENEQSLNATGFAIYLVALAVAFIGEQIERYIDYIIRHKGYEKYPYK